MNVAGVNGCARLSASIMNEYMQGCQARCMFALTLSTRQRSVMHLQKAHSFTHHSLLHFIIRVVGPTMTI